MEIDSRKRPRVDTPLEGVIVCLTGLTHDVKNQLHDMIESLGGRYTRDFSIDTNTHLVASVAQGAKYDLAKSHSHINVVKPSWLLACSKIGTRVDETPHLLGPEANGELTTQVGNDAIALKIELLLNDGKMFCSVFKNCRFYLLGFEEHADFKKALEKLIRRGMGTIYWDLNEETTTLVLHNSCDASLRKAAKVVTECHMNLPSAVSPAWIVDSYKAGCLLSETQYPPTEPVQTPKPAPSFVSKPPRKLFQKMNYSTVFRGCLFSLSRVAPPPWAVDFASKEQEALIRSHSGQMLSLKLLDAIRIDAGSGGLRRQCYVVCWGGRPQIHLNPFLSELQRKDLCTLVEVTPMWLKACVVAQKRLRTDTLPLALAPQPWPLRRLDSSISIVLSGFTGTQKLAITKLIEAVGGRITGDMTKSNTHLICHEGSSSPKVAKASQWGIHIVTMGWLEHVIEHGLTGQHKDKRGCEFRFSFKLTMT